MSSTDNKLQSMPPALLIHGGPISLSAARTLGRRGIKVYAIDQPQNYVRHSRFSEWVPLDYESNPHETWLEYLLGDGLKKLAGAVILPCSDLLLEFVARYRSRLESHYRIYEADDEVMMAMLDKEKTYELAAKAGVPTPRIVPVASMDDIERVKNEVQYPCGLKPRISHEFIKYFNDKLLLANNADELRAAFERVNRFNLEMILTEIIPGSDDSYCSYYSYIDGEGKPLFHFTKRKLRQYPNNFGLGTYHITDWSEDVAEMGLRFFQGIGYRGVGNIEFKRDPRDGKLKVIECNARMTLITEMITISGINIPLLIYNKLTGRPLPPLDSYKRGVRLIRPIVDILAFNVARKRGEITTWQYIKSIAHRQHFMYFRWSDPMPSLVRVVPFISQQFRRYVLRRPDIVKKKGELTAAVPNIQNAESLETR